MRYAAQCRRSLQLSSRARVGAFGGGMRVKGDAATGAGFFAALGFFASRPLRF
jgi:hypothetical protein